MSILSFPASPFDLERRKHATQGIALAGGEHTSADFYARYLKKALHHAGKIEFVDRLFGEKYGDHFKYTLRVIVREYAAHCVAPTEVKVHSGSGNRIPHCRNEVADFNADVAVAIETYDLNGAGPTLPHERYLLTDQFAFEIGRGLDLFDKDTNLNRDVSISFKSQREIQVLLDRAASSKAL